MRPVNPISVFGRFCLGLVLATATYPGIVIAQVRNANAAGYGGGEPFREDCGSRYLIGMRIAQGDVVDSIQPICGEFDAKGGRRNTFVFPGSQFGGGGGLAKQILCPPPAVIRGLKIDVVGDFVANVHLLCRNLSTGEWTEAGTGWRYSKMVGPVEFKGKVPSFEGSNFNCRDNEVGYGFYGRAGGLLDSVGLICRVMIVRPGFPVGLPGAGLGTALPDVPAQGPARIRRVGAPPPAVPVQTTPVIRRIGTPASPPAAPMQSAPMSVPDPSRLYALHPSGEVVQFTPSGRNAFVEKGVVAQLGDGNRALIPGGGDSFYLWDAAGQLYWRRHDGSDDGQDRWSETGDSLGDLSEFSLLFSGGSGVIYGVKPDGTLWWMRHTDWQGGTGGLTAPAMVGNGGWGQFTRFASSGDGLIFAIKSNGDLSFFHHPGWRTGAVDITGPGRVGMGGWQTCQSLAGSSNGGLHCLTAPGEIRSYRLRNFAAYRSSAPPAAQDEGATALDGWVAVGRSTDTLAIIAPLP